MWLLLIGFIVLIFIIRFIIAGTVRGFARGIARAQLRTYKILKRRYPDLDSKKLYIRMIRNRPGYNREEAERVLRLVDGPLVKKLNIIMTPIKDEKVLNLRNVVLHLAWYEYRKRTGHSVGMKYNIMKDAVNNIIPDNL